MLFLFNQSLPLSHLPLPLTLHTSLHTPVPSTFCLPISTTEQVVNQSFSTFQAPQILHIEMHRHILPRSRPQQGRIRVLGSLRRQILRGQCQSEREDAGRGAREGWCGGWRNVWGDVSCERYIQREGEWAWIRREHPSFLLGYEDNMDKALGGDRAWGDDVYIMLSTRHRVVMTTAMET